MKKKTSFLYLHQKKFSFHVVLRLRGKIRTSSNTVPNKIFFAKSEYFDITNKEILEISKSKPKKSQTCVPLKVHKREKFFGSDFEFFTIYSLLSLNIKVL